MLEKRSHQIAVAVVGLIVFFLLLMGMYLSLTYEEPRVQSFDSEFGEVDEDAITVDTSVVVTNPNPWPIPFGLGIHYDVTLNEVTVVSGTESGVQISSGENTLDFTASFNNSQVPAWWVTHINNDETTTMTTSSSVSLGWLPMTITMPDQTEEIETDLLGELAQDDEMTVTIGEHSLLVVEEQQATWGTANETVTPLTFTTEIENVHERPIDIVGTEYTIRMNNITVGSGNTDDGIHLDPGESGTFSVDATIDTQTMERWWMSHIQQGESTELHIETFAMAKRDDELLRIPIAMYEQRSRFTTDILGTGQSDVELIETEPQDEFVEPEMLESTSEWGEVSDSTTEIVTEVEIVNENPPVFNELLLLDVHQRTTFSDVVVIDETTQIDWLPEGEGALSVTSLKEHSVVPEWWAAHLNNDESSTVTTELTGEADLAVTTIPVDLEDRAAPIETELLEDLNSDETHHVGDEEIGSNILVVHETSAVWGEATPEEGPIHLAIDIENKHHETVYIKEIDYRIDINGIVLADTRVDEEYSLSPGERRTIHLELVLDNAKMEDWWPTHITNDEISVMSRYVEATIETGVQSERVEFDFLSENVTIETDLLAGE